MENILIVSEKSWNKELVSYLQSTMPQYAFYLISQKEDFTVERIGSISPVKIFIPHWSYIIPSAIFERYECIVFHMTDLPYGRGGSPLQNLIVRGLTATKLSALRVEAGLDTGPVYLKMDLSLLGTAEEIFVRANKLVGKMIVEIIQNNLQPVPQEGDPVVFKRRKPEQSDMSGLEKLEEIFDYIRMLDADGYPHAYIEKGEFRYEFTRASIKADGSIVADVKITEK
jgi:methionyl-tRNA formyltransferase